MTTHRLPGMSIPATEYDRLERMSHRLGTTKSDLIRAAVAHYLHTLDSAPDGGPSMVVDELMAEVDQLRRLLAIVRKQMSQTDQLIDQVIAA